MIKKLLQKLFLIPNDYKCHIRWAKLCGIKMPWFRPRNRALKKIQNPKLYNEGNKITITGSDRGELDGSFVITKAEPPQYVLEDFKFEVTNPYSAELSRRISKVVGKTREELGNSCN